MSPAPDILSKIEAQTKLQNLALKLDLDKLDASLDKLFTVTAPEIKDLISQAELKTLLTAVKAGTADNNQTARFLGIATSILNKLP